MEKLWPKAALRLGAPNGRLAEARTRWWSVEEARRGRFSLRPPGFEEDERRRYDETEFGFSCGLARSLLASS